MCQILDTNLAAYEYLEGMVKGTVDSVPTSACTGVKKCTKPCDSDTYMLEADNED